MKSLIAFYSRADENYFGGSYKFVEIGNTEIAAKKLQKITGSDLFKIEQTIPYAKNYQECITEAKKDKNSNARPELKSLPESIADYDTIYLGYPNYWGTMPMAVFTFLESFDFTGKTIKPFCTNEGSGMGSSESDIKRLCPTAKIENGLAINGSHVNAADSALKSFAN